MTEIGSIIYRMFRGNDQTKARKPIDITTLPDYNRGHKFESPELKRRKDLKENLNRESNWEKNIPGFHKTSSDEDIDKQIIDERRRIARDNRFLFDSPAGLHCDYPYGGKHPEQIYATGSGYPIGGKYKEYPIFFCLTCAEKRYENDISRVHQCLLDIDRGFPGFISPEVLKKDLEEYKNRLSELKKGNFLIRDLEDCVALHTIGYDCPSCGIVNGEPYKDWPSDNHRIDRCLICGEAIGEYWK